MVAVTCFLHVVVCHVHCFDLGQFYPEPIDLNLVVHSALEDVRLFRALKGRGSRKWIRIGIKSGIGTRYAINLSHKVKRIRLHCLHV